MHKRVCFSRSNIISSIINMAAADQQFDAGGDEIAFFDATPPLANSQFDPDTEEVFPDLEPDSYMSGLNSNNDPLDLDISSTAQRRHLPYKSEIASGMANTRKATEQESGISGTTFFLIVIGIILLLVLGVFLYQRFFSNSRGKRSGDSGAAAAAVEKVKKTVKFEDNNGGGGGIPNSGVINDAATWKKLVESAARGDIDRPVIVAFTMTRCGHCSNMKPELMKAIKQSSSENVAIYNLDYADEQWKQAAMMQQQVNQFPTIKKFQTGKPIDNNSPGAVEFNGPRTADNILAFAKQAQ